MNNEEEFNNDGIQKVKILNKKNFYNNRANKKEINLKRAEIFLFDENNEKIDDKNKGEKKDKKIENNNSNIDSRNNCDISQGQILKSNTFTIKK